MRRSEVRQSGHENIFCLPQPPLRIISQWPTIGEYCLGSKAKAKCNYFYVAVNILRRATRVSWLLPGARLLAHNDRHIWRQGFMKYRNSPMPTRVFGITLSLIGILLQAAIVWPIAAQTRVPLQPFAQQVRQVETSLAYLGQPVAQNDEDAINQAIGNANEAAAIER